MNIYILGNYFSFHFLALASPHKSLVKYFAILNESFTSLKIFIQKRCFSVFLLNKEHKFALHVNED